MVLRDRTVLGRTPDCDIQLDDLRVSKRHCVIERREAHYFVRDLESTSGTFVNSLHVKGEVPLKDGDEIALGSSRIRFREGDDKLLIDSRKRRKSFGMPEVADLGRSGRDPPLAPGQRALPRDAASFPRNPAPPAYGPPPFVADAQIVIPHMPRASTDLHLNTWFPDEPNSDVHLPVGKPARLCVNLGPPHIPSGAGKISPLDAAALAKLAKEGALDVLVLCPGARVKPLRKRMPLPPDPKTILEFTLTPLRDGKLDLQIVLLIKNEPIHRTFFPIEAFKTEGTSILGVVP